MDKTLDPVVKESKKVEMEDVPAAEGIKIQWLIADKEGSHNIHLRKFILEPGASMPKHLHENTEHLQYYLEGEVKVTFGKEEIDLKKDNVLFIPQGAAHAYDNESDEKAEFLCIVPGKDIKTKILD